MTRKSSKSGKSSRQKQSSEDNAASESQMDPVVEQADADAAAANEYRMEEQEEAESDSEEQVDAPTLTELIIEKFSGEKVAGQFEGYGLMEFSNGNVYEGDFMSGKMHGKGKYFWTETGLTYEGDFACNEITGTGIYTWPDGSMYEGAVAAGVRHGFGKFIHPCGIKYEGDWCMGIKQGRGKLYFDSSNSNYYDGSWLNDKRHGSGVRQYPSGNVYEGMWFAGLRHGHGTMRWCDRYEVYTGQWEDGLQHGVGQHMWLMHRAQGSQYVMRNVYDGDFVRGQRQGYGVFYYPSGSRYEGQWHKDLKCGHGKFIFKNGRVFEGQFRDDRMVEFPNFSHDGRTTPDHSSIRTRSPMPDEARSVHSNPSVNTLSPGFQLMLDHLFVQERLEDLDFEEETAQASFVAIHHLGKLRKIYNFYATLGVQQLEDNANVLKMVQLWRLMKDCRMPNEDWTLAKFNRQLVSHYNSVSLETMHNPMREVVFLDFLSHLVTVAVCLYSTAFPLERGLVANCFRKLINENLLPFACSVEGIIFSDSKRAEAAVAFATDSWQVFHQICSSSSSSGQESVMTVRQFLRALQQFKLLESDVGLTAQKVVQVLSSDDQFVCNGDFLLFDRELTFLEFFECLVGCSTHCKSTTAAVPAAAAEAAASDAAAAAAATKESADAIASGITTESEPASAAKPQQDEQQQQPQQPQQQPPQQQAEAAAAAVAAGQQPQLPDENYLLLPPEPQADATDAEAADAAAAAAAAAAADADATKSATEQQQHKSKAGDASSKQDAKDPKKSKGSLRPNLSESKLGHRDSTKDKPASSRNSKEQERKSDSRKSGKSGEKDDGSDTARSSGSKEATQAAASEAAMSQQQLQEQQQQQQEQQQQQQQKQQEEEDVADVADLPEEEREAALAERRRQRWQQQLQRFFTERLLPAAEKMAEIEVRVQQRMQMEQQQQQQQQQQQMSSNSVDSAAVADDDEEAQARFTDAHSEDRSQASDVSHADELA